MLIACRLITKSCKTNTGTCSSTVKFFTLKSLSVSNYISNRLSKAAFESIFPQDYYKNCKTEYQRFVALRRCHLLSIISSPISCLHPITGLHISTLQIWFHFSVEISIFSLSIIASQLQNTVVFPSFCHFELMKGSCGNLKPKYFFTEKLELFLISRIFR